MSALDIDKSRTCLVLIDLQKGITAMETQPHDVKTVVANAAELARAFRKNRMPVFLVRVSALPGTALHPVADMTYASQGDTPSDWSDIVPELGAEPSDVVITKRQWGAFYGTDLELRLRRGGVDTIVLGGISTSRGVESTARFAYEFGFLQFFAEVAMSYRSAEAHRNAVEFALMWIGRVRSSSVIISAIG